MGKTTISWTQETWNPVRGCSPISPGCKNCYAEKTAGRFCKEGEPFDGFVQIGKNGDPGPHWTGKVELIPHMLDVPLRRRKPTTYFVNSMSDLFHEGLPYEDIDRVFAVMALCPQHTFQVLTKRADRMLEWASRDVMGVRIHTAMARVRKTGWGNGPEPPFPLPNVWLGVSTEDQQRADERIPLLLQTPAAVRFLSVEPLLGPVDLRALPSVSGIGRYLDALSNAVDPESDIPSRPDWVIVGGESGPGARPCDVAWIRSIVQQCGSADVPVFVKQFGAKPYEVIDIAVTASKGRSALYIRDPKGGDIAEFPEDLRVREMPATAKEKA